MNFEWKILSVLFACLVVGTTTAHATTWYVAKTGSNNNTCAQAQSTATPKLTITGASGGMACLVTAGSLGHILYIRSGTYSEFIDSAVDTVPTGTSYNNAPVIASYPGEVATMTQPSVQTPQNIILFLYSGYIQYVIFKDLVLDGGYQNVKVGISGTTHHVKFDNVEAKNGWHQCVSWQVNTHDNWWHGGKIHDCGLTEPVVSAGYPAYIGGMDQLFENVEMYNSNSFCMHIYDSNVPPQRVTMRNSIVHHCALQRNVSSAILEKGDSNAIYNNIVYSSSGHGIQAYSGTNAKIYNNTVYGGAQTGIYVLPGVTSTDVQNNISYLNATTQILNSGNGTILSSNLTSNPLFINAATLNFALQASSPAIDAGARLGLVTTDIINTPRPQGAAYDIGAYEFITSGGSINPPQNLNIQ